jgi:hypothetical protein
MQLTSINLNSIYALLKRHVPSEVSDAKLVAISRKIERIADLNLNKLSISFQNRNLVILYEVLKAPLYIMQQTPVLIEHIPPAEYGTVIVL